MAEVLTMQVNSNIGKVAKETKDWAKSLDEVNEQVTIQNKVINDLEKDLIKLKQQQDAIPKGAFFAGMGDLNKKIRETSNELKLEKLALKDLTNQQKEATTEVKKYNKAQKEQEDAIKGTIGNFQVFGVSINGIRKSISQIIPLMRLMFKTIMRGILSTGIGALLIAFGSLVTYVTSTKEGMDKLNVVLAKVGAFFNVIKDRISTVGKAVSLFMRGKFKEAAASIKDVFKDVTKEIKEETKAAGELEKATQRLRDRQNEFTIEKVKTRKEIEKARLLAEDETKSAEERREALEKALKLEQETSSEEVKLAKERARIFEENMKMSKHTAAEEEELANLKAEIIRKEIASLRLQKRVKTEMNEMDNEIARKKKEEEDEAERKRKEKEKADKKRADEEIALAKKVAAQKMAILKAEEDFKKATIEKGFGAASALAGENAALSKGVAAAQTIYQTQQGIMAAMGATSVGDKLLPYPVRLANAIATGVMGAAALSKILSTNPTGGGASAGATPTATSQTPAPQMLGGAFTLGGGEQPEPLKAFVVTDEMTNSQNQLANIRRRATI